MSLTDNTLATATNLGTLSSPTNIADMIGGTDPVSYYKFTLSANSDIAGTVDWGVRSGTPPFLRLVVDFNGNGFVEDNERIRTLSAGADGSFFQSLPLGSYYLEVSTGNFLTRDYSIQVGATPKPGNVSPDPGATFGQAFDTGALSAQRVLRDYISNAIDPVDTYKFTLSQKTNIGVLINGTTQNLRLFFAADTNGNGVYDADETRTTFSGGTNTTSSVLLEPGTYFLQAATPSGSTFTYATHYELTLNPVPDFSGDDTLLGTPGGDTLNGFAGNDSLSGLDGADILLGDAGNDTLLGGNGNDVMDGGIDNDRIEGGAGSDRLVGLTGSDILLGGAGNDTLLGGVGNDVMNGSIGNDRIAGGAGRDRITTGAGRDTIIIGLREGVDIVRDFSDRRDRIDLAGRLSFGQLTIRQSGRNALVGAGGSTLLVLQNVNANVLTRSDFI